ncbi:hypothetical protein D3C85_690390 [compost metagenome]
MKTLPTSFMTFIIIIFFIKTGFSQAITITPCNINSSDWVIDGNSTGNINFTLTGLLFNAPAVDKNYRIRLKNYANTPLQDITVLKYSTLTNFYKKQVPFIALQIKYVDSPDPWNTITQRLKGTRMFPLPPSGPNTQEKDTIIPASSERVDFLVFEPRFQDDSHNHTNAYTQNIVTNIWQDWDLLQGVWWINYSNGIDPINHPSSSLLFNLKDFIKYHPEAILYFDPTKGGEPIRLTVGDGPNETWSNLSYADSFIIRINDQSPKGYIFRVTCN